MTTRLAAVALLFMIYALGYNDGRQASYAHHSTTTECTHDAR